MRSYYESFDEIRFELDGVLDAPHTGEVVALVTLHTRGKGSGVEVDIQVAHLLSVRDGKVVRGKVFMDRDEARQAAGIT